VNVLLDRAGVAAADERLRDASRSLEAMLLRQIIDASGAFKGGEGAGSGVRADLFAGALADAVARSGGIGLADQIARSLGGGNSAHAPAPVPAPGVGLGLVHGEARFAAPVDGAVTSRFGQRRDPFSGDPAVHHGLDFGAPEDAPIRAPAGGVVRSAGPRGGYGNAVEIDHGGGVVTLYGHASELLVAAGDRVVQGQEIARVGRTGRATGAHLHFEVRVGGRPVDPARVLKTYAHRADELAGHGPQAGRTP
jgi:murein DD-endopeptidase MepM/ murein hydrolase activator NlpD